MFADARGGYRDRNNIESAFRQVRTGAPFDWVVPHTYRETVAMMLDQGGLSARIIADQLGHSRISMTQDIYMGRRAVEARWPRPWSACSMTMTTVLNLVLSWWARDRLCR